MRKLNKSLFGEKILAQLERHFDKSGISGKKAVYPLIKKAVEHALIDIPPDTKLPSIRQIAEKINVTGVSVQKAIRALIAEKSLYSKAKSGIFISGKKYNSNLNFTHDTQGRLSFATDSCLPYQRKLWTCAAESFESGIQMNKAFIDYDFAYDYDKPTVKTPDALECSEWTLNTRTPEKPFLNLKEFITAETALPLSLVKDVLLPLYHKVSCILYVPELLLKYNLKKPSYATYEEQLEYFSTLDVSLRKSNGTGLIMKQPSLTAFSPDDASCFFGELNSKMFSGECKFLSDRIHKMKSLFAGRVVSSPDIYADGVKDFCDGRFPVLVCDSGEVWQLLSAMKPESFKAWPLLNMDNECVSMPIAGAVFAATRYPLECIRFLLHLLGSDMQERFSAAGHAAYDGGSCSIFEDDPEAFALFKKTFSSKTADRFIFTQVEHYIKYCILDPEVRKYISGLQSPEEALRRSFMLARAFLNSRNCF